MQVQGAGRGSAVERPPIHIHIWRNQLESGDRREGEGGGREKEGNDSTVTLNRFEYRVNIWSLQEECNTFWGRFPL